LRKEDIEGWISIMVKNK